MPRPSPQTDRVVAVLNLLAETGDGGATVTEIARRTGANRASCVHTLAALETAGYLVRDPADRRYHLGPVLVTLGSTAAHRYPGFAEARHEIDDLTRVTGHPCFAFAPERDRARLLHYTWDLRRPAPAMRVGDTIRLVPPLGAVFVAWAGKEAVDEWLARGAGDASTDARHREMLAAVRELGYVVELQPPSAMFDDLLGDGRSVAGSRPVRAYDPGDFVVTDLVEDRRYAVSSISAPVFDADATVVLALNLTGFPVPVAGAEIRRLAAIARGAAAHVHV